MYNNLEKLHETDDILAKLVDGNNITAKEAEDLTYNIFTNDREGIHFANFFGAIHAKGETDDELFGFVNAISKLAAKFEVNIDKNRTIDLSGTGGGAFKTINVSTAASFVVAVAGYDVVKNTYFAVTSPTGSADVFTKFGVDFFKLTKKQSEKVLKGIGICPAIVPFLSPKMKNYCYLNRKTFFERQLRVRTPLHLVANAYSPVPMNHRIYGCYSEKYLDILANLYRKLGFKHSMTFYADIGIPEISNVGRTIIVEQNGDNIKKYSVTPTDLGVREAKEADIKTGGKEKNMSDFITILMGEQRGAKSDLVAINAGAALYVLGDVKTLAEGVKKAKSILETGEPFKKFEEVISQIGSLESLNKYIKSI